MEVKLSPKKIVAAVVVIAILAGGYFYMKQTAEVRRYKSETNQLRLISEHQEVEIKVIEQKARLDNFKRGAPSRPPMPPAESPREQELRRKAEEEKGKKRK